MVFGRIMTGSASRFASQGRPLEPSIAPDVANAQLQKPPAPLAYQGLRTGPEFHLEYEANQTPSLDGSADLPRVLSPFMLQVEPPLAWANLNPSNDGPDMAGILALGHKDAPSAFQSARQGILQALPEGPQLSNTGSVEEYVAQGIRSKPVGASRTETRESGTTGPSRIGTPAIADVYTAVDITMQLRALVETPPLILLINPQQLQIAYTKVQQFTDRTRFGYVFQAWGEEQPRLQITSRCGAFISGGRGVQYASRRDSAAWQNLATALHFYRHNGYIYDTVGKSNAHHFVGALSIHYDSWVYYGNMQSFSYSFDENNVHGGIVFEMEFIVNAMVDTGRLSPTVSPMRSPIPSLSDPRYAGLENRATLRPGNNRSIGTLPKRFVPGEETMGFQPVVSGGAPDPWVSRPVPFRVGT